MPLNEARNQFFFVSFLEALRGVRRPLTMGSYLIAARFLGRKTIESVIPAVVHLEPEPRLVSAQLPEAGRVAALQRQPER